VGIYKRGKIWWIDYYVPPGRGGKRIRERVGPDKDEARIELAARLRDIRQGRNPELRRIAPKPFKEMVREFKERHIPRCRSPRSYEVKVGMLLRHFGERTLQELGPRQIEEFIAQRLDAGTSRATTNRYRAVLSKIYNCAIAWGYYGGENPVRAVKRFPESPGRVRFLSAEEAGKLIEHAPRHLCPVVVSALHTGGRLSEILGLRWDDVDLERGVLYFDQRNTKSGKQREVPVDIDLRAVLQERRRVRAIGGDARDFVFTRHGKRLRDVRTAFEKARRRAGLGADVTFHTLRHTFASWYAINGGDLYRLQKYLGHSTIALTQRYAHLSPEYIKAGAQYFGPPAEARSHAVDTNRPPDAVSEAVTA